MQDRLVRTLKSGWQLFRAAWDGYSDDRAARMAAGLSFYTAFSIAPMLVIAIAIAGFIFGEEAARGEVSLQLQALLGPQAAQFVESMVERAGAEGTGFVATLISLATLGWGATRVFVALQDTLNLIWDVERDPDASIWSTLRGQLLSFAMVAVIGFLLLVSLIATTALAALGNLLATVLPAPVPVWEAINFVFSFAVVTLLFALIFRVLPDTDVAWREVWTGAIVTALLFTVGKTLIGAYLGQSSTVSVFGAAGSLAVFLLWVYYMAQVVFFGAELTRAHAKRRRARRDEAKPVKHERRAARKPAPI